MKKRTQSKRRLWLFRLTALILSPVLLLLVLEGSLHLVDYGMETSAVLSCDWNGRPAYCENRCFSYRYFPFNACPEFKSFLFLKDKPENTYRIFVLGASAAQGVPDKAYAFSAILRCLLRTAYPGVDIEVINTGIVATNSHVVREIAQDLAPLDGDLFVVYLGNNEVVGPFGPGTVASPFAAGLGMIRLGMAVKETRLGQFLDRQVRRFSVQEGEPTVWSGMGMFLEKQVRGNDPRLETVYAHFQENLQDIRDTVSARGIPILFSTVARNLKDNPPFGSLYCPDLSEEDRVRWEAVYQSGVVLEEAGQYAEAEARYRLAARIDASFADLAFRLGLCCWHQNKMTEARDWYVKACENDTLRFRPVWQINEAIRHIAADREDQGVYLADCERAVEENSPSGIPGESLFYEHVHLNFEGNYVLARTLFDRMQALLPDWLRQAGEAEPAVASVEECAAQLAYSDWDRYLVTSKMLNGFIMHAPFTNQLYHSAWVARLQEQLRSMQKGLSSAALAKAARLYKRAIKNDPDNWMLHQKYAGLLAQDENNYEAAVRQYQEAARCLPHSFVAHREIGSLALKQGRFEAAIASSLRSLEIYPDDPATHYNLGLAYQKKGALDKAEAHFRRTIEIMPYHVPAFISLAQLLQKQSRPAEGIPLLEKALQFVPDSLELHLTLAGFQQQQGDREGAEKTVRAALKIQPDSKAARKALKALLQKNPGR